MIISNAPIKISIKPFSIIWFVIGVVILDILIKFSFWLIASLTMKLIMMVRYPDMIVRILVNFSNLLKSLIIRYSITIKIRIMINR